LRIYDLERGKSPDKVPSPNDLQLPDRDTFWPDDEGYKSDMIQKYPPEMEPLGHNRTFLLYER
jgi:hypothetical protein